MLVEWNSKNMGWMEAASAYTGYDRKLSALLRGKIVGDTLCDIGCGMALCDFELAPDMRSITCVDISRSAIEYVSSRIAALGVNNMTAVNSDGTMLSGKWDTVLALFHGQADSVAERYLELANHRLILVTHAQMIGNTGPEQYRLHKNCNGETVAANLASLGMNFTMEHHSLEFGQPLRDYDDALEYVRMFSGDVPDEILREHIESFTQKTGRSDYPLYYPKTRRFCVFTIYK